MTPEKRAVARQLYGAKQHTTAQIAQLLGVSRTSLYRHLSIAASNPGHEQRDRRWVEDATATSRSRQD